MTDKHVVRMDGFSKVSPITEGYVVKGGINATSQIAARPPAPAPMRPAGQMSSSSASAPKKS